MKLTGKLPVDSNFKLFMLFSLIVRLVCEVGTFHDPNLTLTLPGQPEKITEKSMKTSNMSHQTPSVTFNKKHNNSAFDRTINHVSCIMLTG